MAASYISSIYLNKSGAFIQKGKKRMKKEVNPNHVYKSISLLNNRTMISKYPLDSYQNWISLSKSKYVMSKTTGHARKIFITRLYCPKTFFTPNRSIFYIPNITCKGKIILSIMTHRIIDNYIRLQPWVPLFKCPCFKLLLWRRPHAINHIKEFPHVSCLSKSDSNTMVCY